MEITQSMLWLSALRLELQLLWGHRVGGEFRKQQTPGRGTHSYVWKKGHLLNINSLPDSPVVWTHWRFHLFIQSLAALAFTGKVFSL